MSFISAKESFQLLKWLYEYQISPTNNFETPRNFNIHFAGYMGAGKSSGLNSLFSAVDSRLVRRTMVRAAADESITLDFNLRPLTQNIRIGDSWGWDNNNYNLREFEYILKGQLPLKFEEGGPLDANLLNTLPKNSLTADNRIHCVIFYYPAPSIGNAETVKRFDYFRKIAEKANVSYIIALSLVDRVVKDLSQQPYLIYTHPTVQKLVKDLATSLGILESIVVPVISYTFHTHKNEYIDTISLRLLKTAIHVCEDWCREQSDINII